MYLIAAETSVLDWIWVVFQVAAGLGAVIFVHELGHFLVAKACGVKCEKFYIGFDIGGYKICRQWGETEYGIGILPLGGYVKMLGQDDNPARMAEENERSKIHEDEPTSSEDAERESKAANPSADATEADDFVLDPRSYMAKSVPQRMAIISAGVIMNLIFAMVFAVIAYGVGVKYTPAIVSHAVPGSPAWKADLRPGDRIVEIGGLKNPRFTDLQHRVALSDLEKGIPLVIERPGRDEPQSMMLQPEHTKGLFPAIGVAGPRTLTLVQLLEGWPSSHATPPLLVSDRVIAVGGEPVAKYEDLVRLLVKQPGDSLELTVIRGGKASKDDPDALPTGGEELVVTVPANPMKRLGIVMKLGPITAVQIGSPAADAGLVAGDVILRVDGEPVGDPLTLPERLRRKAVQGLAVTLVIERSGSPAASQTLEETISLRQPTALESSDAVDAPISIPALGITCRVLNQVASVEAAGPAAKAGIAAGDVLVKTSFVVGKQGDGDAIKLSSIGKALVKEKAIKFDDTNHNWPALNYVVQSVPDGVEVQLVVKRGAAQHSFDIAPTASDEWFNPDRGLITQKLRYTRTAATFSEQVQLGFAETTDSASMVFRLLRKLVGGQISARALGGPVTIARAAGYSAFDGVASLLVFLTMLSANLAVINFLPIPLLDGGHMVFLTLEAILRRPVNEKIVIAFHTIGFVLIISLMLFVLALDFGIISRFPS